MRLGTAGTKARDLGYSVWVSSGEPWQMKRTNQKDGQRSNANRIPNKPGICVAQVVTHFLHLMLSSTIFFCSHVNALFSYSR